MEMNEQIPAGKPVYLENDGLTYVYDFTQLKVIQAENAREIAEFRYYQQMKDAQSIRDIMNSRANEWLCLCSSYLLLPVIDGVTQKYSEAVSVDAEKFVKNLPVVELKRLEEIVSDFFTNIGKSVIISQILQGRGNLLWRQTLLGTALSNISKK